MRLIGFLIALILLLFLIPLGLVMMVFFAGYKFLQLIAVILLGFWNLVYLRVLRLCAKKGS